MKRRITIEADNFDVLTKIAEVGDHGSQLGTRLMSLMIMTGPWWELKEVFGPYGVEIVSIDMINS